MEPEQQADSLATSIVNAAADSTAIEAVADIGEVALDAVLDESLLRDVPVLGTMYKVVHAAGTIRDRLFARKLLLFLEATSDIPDHEREEFAQTMEDDPSFRRKVGEHLILVLEQQDHFDKATILGKLFRGYMRRTIQYEMFRKLSHAVIFTSIDDLSRLPDLYAKLPTRYEISPHDPLIANGFFYAVPTVYSL